MNAAENGLANGLVPAVAPREGFEASGTIGKLAGALAKAQGAFDGIAKTREVTVTPKKEGARPYKFTYAPLDEVLRAVRSGLAANGLALTQFIADGEDGRRVMTTTLLHESGEWMASTTTLPGVATTAQEFGSQVTYMRRYAIVSILGVVAEEDDDGNTADGNDVDTRGERDPKGRGGTSSQPSVNGSTGTSASATGSGVSSGTPPDDEAVGRALKLSRLLTSAPPDGCGWTKPHCQKWGKKRFGVDDPTQLTEAQYKDAVLLALAYMQGGDTGYKAKLDELVAAGRVRGDDEKGKAA